VALQGVLIDCFRLIDRSSFMATLEATSRVTFRRRSPLVERRIWTVSECATTREVANACLATM
jgi:hypothetical protein